MVVAMSRGGGVWNGHSVTWGSGSVGGMTAVSLVAVGGGAISRVVQLSIVDNIG